MGPPTHILTARVERVRATCAALGVDVLAVTHLPNVAYLSGFTGSAGVLVVGPASLVLVTDGRYRTTVEELSASGAVPSGLELRIAPGAFEPEIADAVALTGATRLGIEAAYLSVGQWGRYRRALASRSSGTELVETEGIVESGRIVKDEWEIEVLREAASRLSAVGAGVLNDVREGLREVDVAQAIEAGLRRMGFDKPAFDTIVASGPNSALPHARAGERRLATGDLVVIDFGGMFHGYAVDMTRTVAVGDPGGEARRVYEAVREAQAAAIDRVAPGVTPEAVDAAARDVLEAHGLGPRFVHGTGHGLGLEVHEAPRVAASGTARSAPADGLRAVPAPARIEPGMVFTIEPGAYLPGSGGVRIEDDVLVTAGGCDVLTSGDRALRVC
jgi:Xaa-Pro aminopeptidase